MIPAPTAVVAQPALFLLRLRYGEPSGLSRLIKPTLTGLKAARAAKVGAAVAASPAVATTLFAHTATGGIIGWLGLGAAAATPVGWVIASAAAAGAATYGIDRMFNSDRRTAQLPLTLDAGLDALATRLFDLQAALAMRVAAIDGTVAAAESDMLHRHFTAEWGYAADHVSAGLDRLLAGADTITIVNAAHDLATFTATSIDCNADAMLADLVAFLHDLVLADGRLDEREAMAVDAAVRVFAAELGPLRSAERATQRIGDVAERGTKAVRGRLDALLGRRPTPG